MAAKQYVVTRGQIEKGNEVIAKQGAPYKPKDAAEEKRLLDAGVIAELGAPVKGKGRGKATPALNPPITPLGGKSGDDNAGDGVGGQGDEIGSGSAAGGSPGDK